MQHFDEVEWHQVLTKPDWYLPVDGMYKIWRAEVAKLGQTEARQAKVELKDFLAARLNRREINLGEAGPDWDAKRKPIDTIVIHHTSNSASYGLDRLNVTHLLNLYVDEYAHDPAIKGQPIWSNHLRNGRQVFWAYHWLVRRNGEAIRLLDDNENGWHAGNSEINNRSVAICLDNDYSHSSPSQSELQRLAKLIRGYGVSRDQTFGHREINSKTECPGDNYLNVWKQKLVEMIDG